MKIAKFMVLVATLGLSISLPATAQMYEPGSAADIVRKEAMTEFLGEGEIINFIDGSKMVGADYFTVLVEGEGPDVVLIPGLSTPRAVWDKTREQLKGRYKVHTIQTRGFGDKAPIETLTPENRTLLDTYAFHMADYIDDYVIRIGEGQNPKIIGHSLGGLTAMKVAANMGHQVDRIMVVDSLPFFGLLFGPNTTVDMMKPQAAAMRDALAKRETAEADERTLQTMSATPSGRAQVAAWSKTADPKVTAQFFYDVMTTDIRSSLPRIDTPMTIVYPYHAPDAEALTDSLYKAAFEGAKTVKSVRIDDSRHFIMLDQPEAFAEAVEAFLKD